MSPSIQDPKVEAKLRARAAAVVDGGRYFAEKWLREASALVLPQESALPFDRDLAERLSAAFSACGVGVMYAIPNEPAAETCFSFNCSPEGFAEYNFESSGLDHLLIPGGLCSVAILCSHHDYFLLAGPRDFLVKFAADLKSAHGEFADFALNLRLAFPEAADDLEPASYYLRGEFSVLSDGVSS